MTQHYIALRSIKLWKDVVEAQLLEIFKTSQGKALE